MQLCSLERRTARGGKDSIDHSPGMHDDIANAVAGALVTSFRDPGVPGFREPIKFPKMYVVLMTFTPEEDLAKHVRFLLAYSDGSMDVFAVPEATLLQGGVPAVLPIIAWEWQNDGYLKPGTIVAVRLKRFVLN